MNTPNNTEQNIIPTNGGDTNTEMNNNGVGGLTSRPTSPSVLGSIKQFVSPYVLAATLALGGGAMQSCEKDKVAPVVVTPVKETPVEVLKTPTVGFTISQNPDGTVSLNNTTTDATEYSWYVGDKLVGNTKDLANIRVDVDNYYLINKREPKIEGKTNVAANGTYNIKLVAQNKNDKGTVTTADKTIAVEIKDGITLKNDIKFGNDPWDTAGINWDGYTYKDPKTGENVDIVTIWNMGPEYSVLRTKNIKELEAMGAMFVADMLRWLTVIPVENGTLSGFTQDFPKTFKDIEAYQNQNKDGLIYSPSRIGLAIYDEAQKVNIAVGTNISKDKATFEEYLNLDVCKLLKTGSYSIGREDITLQNKAKDQQGIELKMLLNSTTGITSLRPSIDFSGKTHRIKSETAKGSRMDPNNPNKVLDGFYTRNADPSSL